MKRMSAWIAAAALSLVACVTLAQSPEGDERKADHDALRALLAKSAKALNSRDLDAVKDAVSPAFTVITVDNQKLVGLDAVKKYYAGLFEGPGAALTKLEVKPVADELTRFVGDGVGVVYGLSDDTYTFKDGEQRTMPTRWSAVVVKEGDAWKLVNVHFSANVLDNPLVAATRAYAQKMMIVAALIGLVVGALIVLLVRRRPA